MAGESTSEADASACLNCDANLNGPFCGACGQERMTKRLDTRSVLLDAIHNFVNWESTGLRTVRGLFINPGQVAAQYVAGKRKSYVSPARLCLITLALWLLATRWIGVDPLEASGIRFDPTDADSRAALLADDVRKFLARHLDVLLYLALPLRAVLLKWFFRRSARNVAETFVLVLYVASLGFVISIFLTPLILVQPRLLMGARQLLTLLLSIYAARHFFEASWLGATWRVTVAALLHVIATALLFALIALPFLL